MKLKVLIWIHGKLSRLRYRVGAVELKCPSCTANTDIDSLRGCECGTIACTECIRCGEDSSLCPACWAAACTYYGNIDSEPPW